MSGALILAPTAAPAWRPRAPWERPVRWTLWAAAALHAAVLAAILMDLGPREMAEPKVVEGTPLVWEGPIGAGEGAPELSPSLPAPPPAPAPPSAAPPPPAPPVETPPPPEPSPPVPQQPAPSEAAAMPEPSPAPPLPPPPAAVAPPPAPSPAPNAPPAAAPPSPAPQPTPPRAAEAAPLPLPPPPAPPAPARPTPPAPAPAPSAPTVQAAPPAAGAPMRTVEVPVAPGAVRLGAGTAGSPGESRAVGAPQPGCQDVIGYPASERQRGVTGAVGLRLRVSDDGRVVEARIAESSGYAGLDEAAQRGIRRCRFIPALRDGVPVWGSRDYRVVFQLN
ncbi:energy transducer TonB [Roseomonas populi]|uniref:Energy transducer TonB n=1 Tax=Roseomonas populi TaxID=3121582 RepID=A0ABT1X635_9PROT|nr:energy transducer TonB [Roseomonas pecuniae]MCR0983545.1 energy transducer TonB [Roseomonas pecuniae]